MKLLILSVVLGVVVCEPPAPYPPSGWRPNGPAFELPQKPQKQEYLPPVDPRRPVDPNFDNGEDVSVQGLPTVEQQPIFQLSPVNGQQYNGPNINADIRNLDPSFRQIQYQQQQQRAQEFARQREFDARVQPSNGLPNLQAPRQFAQTTTRKPEFKSNAEPTTETFDLNQAEQLDNPKQSKENVSLEVTKQNIQEYPPELFLSPLTQLKIQPQFVPIQQLGQLQAYYQPKQSPGFDGPAHLAALPSVLTQKQLLEQQTLQPFVQNPIVVQEPLEQYQPINQYQPQIQAYPFQAQPVVLQPQAVNQIQPNQFPQPNQFVQPNQFAQPAQFQPNPQVQQPDPDSESIDANDQQIQVQGYPQYQTPVLVQPQLNQSPQPNQFIQSNQFYQPSQFPQSNQFVQPAQVAQPSLFAQPAQFAQANQFVQPQVYQSAQPQPSEVDAENIQNQPQIIYQNYQPQVYQPNPYQEQVLIGAPNQNQYAQSQGQVALQSGINDQQDNGVETEEVDEQNDEGNRSTAVATAFGTRTQPRIVPTYGAPVPNYQTTTEAAQDESSTEDAPVIAQATAIATGRRKSAKLRSRRVRPVFTLDKSGHLVLAQEQ